jgi:nucleotide-binding universal stress UspA family protein
MDIRKILLPLDLFDPTPPITIVRQAAGLAHHFGAELLVLHVVRPLTYIARSKTAAELLEQEVEHERKQLEADFGPELAGLSVRRLVLKGDPAREIVDTAERENVGMIVMASHGYGAIDRFIVGSVTIKVLHHSSCPVWTGIHLDDDGQNREFAIRNVLCAVDFSPLSVATVRWAQDMATELGAQLTLAHVTPSVEIYGPGGFHVLPQMKEELVSSATRMISKLQEEAGTKAEVFIGSGDVPKMLSEGIKKTDADLLVMRCRSRGARLGTHGYGIIRESHIPVVSV